MLNKKHFDRGIILTIITVCISALQSYLLHIGTTDFGHSYFSVYFFVEVFILLLTIVTGLQRRIEVITFLFAFIFEIVWFFINERPISSDVLLMLIIGVMRIYIFVWLLKRLTKASNLLK